MYQPFPVKHLDQYDGVNWCGPSVVAEGRNLFFPGRPVSVARAAAEVGANGGFSTFDGMMTASRALGLPLIYSGAATLAFVEYMLARRYNLYCLLDYSALEDKAIPYNLAHFGHAVGMDNVYVYWFDPLRRQEIYQEPSRTPRAEFARMLDNRSRYPRYDTAGKRLYPDGLNYANQALHPFMPYPESLEVLAGVKEVFARMQ
jgi:hypothetical protein